jgi:hypothetical protein
MSDNYVINNNKINTDNQQYNIEDDYNFSEVGFAD